MKSLSPVVPLLALLLAAPALAQEPARSAPITAPLPPALPQAQDEAWPGTIQLDIDASDTTHGLYRVTETIPVAPGTTQLALLLPEWIPGHHSPVGTMAELVDLHFFANGKPLAWRRDPVEIFAFHVDVPAGASEVVAKFVHTSPLQASEGRVTMTPEMLNLQWDRMSLYPAGHYVRRIKVKPRVTVPAGWTVFTALDGQSRSGNTLGWAETDYETLVDSPIFAGINARRWPLGNGVSLDAIADAPKNLALSAQNLANYQALVDEAVLTFGTRHFDHYDSMVALTDKLGGIGLEHHRSSENSMEPPSFTDWPGTDWNRNIVAHEFVHSWNGKFRRPAGLWTPDYRQPMQNNLLWVYEGQTQFWGLVLAARSGIQSRQMILAMLATTAGAYTQMPGRDWRSVEDTTFDPIFAKRKPKPYASLARGEDYYNEGALVWLEADQLIRAGTQGRKGLDDFARAFFGIRNGDRGELTYDFADVVKTLNSVYSYDWAAFLHTRFDLPGQPAPLAGLERGGYRLAWREEPNQFDRARAADAKSLLLTHSLGLTLDKEGKVTSSRWDCPAFNAGIVTGAKIVAVNGTAYDQDAMREAITAAKTGKDPIRLLVQRGDKFLEVPVDYHGGLRYPWLERIGSSVTPAGLDLLLAARHER